MGRPTSQLHQILLSKTSKLDDSSFSMDFVRRVFIGAGMRDSTIDRNEPSSRKAFCTTFSHKRHTLAGLTFLTGTASFSRVLHGRLDLFYEGWQAGLVGRTSLGNAALLSPIRFSAKCLSIVRSFVHPPPVLQSRSFLVCTDCGIKASLTYVAFSSLGLC